MAKTKRKSAPDPPRKVTPLRPGTPRFGDVVLPHQAAAAAAAARADYKQLYDFAPVIWMVLDAVGIVRDISAAGARILGASARFVVGTPFRMWVDQESRIKLLEHFRVCRMIDTPVETEVRICPKDGSPPIMIRLHSRRTSFRGGEVFPTVGIDISAQSSLERAREVAERQRDAAEEGRRAARAAEAVKDRLIATVSHELRNPLSPALLAASTLTSWPALPEKARTLAGVIKRNIELEARLIDDLLDLARVTRGQLDLRLKTVNVHEVVDHAIEACRAAARARDVGITTDLDAADHHALGDAVRLEQVIWNILNNAIKFSARGGYLFVRTTSNLSGTMHITVRDFGAGMEPETIERLFQPFEQPRAPVGGQAGLGLGLTIARSIVDLHNGQIRAESEGPGRGAVFEVELPTIAPEPTGPEHAHLSSRRKVQGKPRVLLIEDHDDTGSMFASCLTQRGYEVTYVRSLKEGLALADKGWDVVLSDIGLADGSGLEIARHAHGRGAEPPHLIAVSGYGSDADVQASRDAGFDCHLVKPIDLEALLELIAQREHAGAAKTIV